MAHKRNKNRLATEKSPYLLQHADNPVEWHPWSNEAFENAKKEDKPILLSIGYSTCHWCHVMEHESFEDESVAKLLNDTFICIKVDREERPDIDQVYMMVCQMMTGSGGWPLTIVMTPEKKPFFAATYLPKESRKGLIGIKDLANQVKLIWKTRKVEAIESAEQITRALNLLYETSAGVTPDEKILDAAFIQIERSYDRINGGFGTFPKFPTPHIINFLIRYWRRTNNPDALMMAEKTLQKMRLGGIYDHIGFGFHRYSTDARWKVPHFEKMLYDQALIANVYLEAFEATQKNIYANTAEEIFEYILREITSPDGAFYSAEDADSEGVEGKYYLWREEEIIKALNADEAAFAIQAFNTTADGNYLDERTKLKTGSNILYLEEEINEDDEIIFKSVRTKLLNERLKRVRPEKDDKILLDWNGLMIAALARGARTLNKSEYAEAAKRAVDFINSKMRKPDGTLIHRFRDGEAAVDGYLDDYAFLIWGLLEMYETTFNVGYLKDAIELNNILMDKFLDDKTGGFFLTSADNSELPAKHKEVHDSALPSGNSVAMMNLLRLAFITEDEGLEKTAADIGRIFSEIVAASPISYAHLLSAVDFGLGPTCQVVITGDAGSSDTKNMIEKLRGLYLPNKIVIFKPSGKAGDEISKIAGFTKNHSVIDGKATAYICKNFTCLKPVTDPDRMIESLKIPLNKAGK